MARWHRLIGIGKRKWWELPSAAAVVLLVRLALWLVPCRILQRLAPTRGISAPSRAVSETQVNAAAIAVARAARAVPGASCLTQAIALRVLLSWMGHPSTLQLGARKRPEGGLAAHAWLESEGRVLIGGSHHEQFVPLAPPSGIAA